MIQKGARVNASDLCDVRCQNGIIVADALLSVNIFFKIIFERTSLGAGICSYSRSSERFPHGNFPNDMGS